MQLTVRGDGSPLAISSESLPADALERFLYESKLMEGRAQTSTPGTVETDSQGWTYVERSESIESLETYANGLRSHLAGVERLLARLIEASQHAA
jgi:hypothetical protein